MQKLGSRIRQVRLSKNLTLEYVAKESDLSTTGYGNIERGHTTNIKLSTLSKIAQVLDTSISDLLLEYPSNDVFSGDHDAEISQLISLIREQNEEISCLRNLVKNLKR